MSIYTYSERTVKKYTVYQAIESARRRLGEANVKKYGLCVNAVEGQPDSTKITLEELNIMAEAIVNDTLYHGGAWG